MLSRSAISSSGSFTWDNTSDLQVEHGATLTVDLVAVNTTFANPGLQWVGSQQPAGSSVGTPLPDKLQLTVPNNLEEPGDKSFQFYVVSTLRSPQPQTSSLTILLKGNPG